MSDKKSGAGPRPAEEEDVDNRQGAAGQDTRRRGANQNRGLRAQLQASRRARLARISEDEHDGMLSVTWCYIIMIDPVISRKPDHFPWDNAYRF